MKRAFVVTLEVGDSANPDQTAQIIEQVLTEVFDVISVNPWDAPSESPTPSAPIFPAL